MGNDNVISFMDKKVEKAVPEFSEADLEKILLEYTNLEIVREFPDEDDGILKVVYSEKYIGIYADERNYGYLEVANMNKDGYGVIKVFHEGVLIEAIIVDDPAKKNIAKENILLIGVNGLVKYRDGPLVVIKYLDGFRGYPTLIE